MINNAGALKLVGVPTGSPSSVQLVDASAAAGLGPFATVVYVDQVRGNDLTGARGNANLPFATVQAAINAMQTGDTLLGAPQLFTITAAITIPAALVRFAVAGPTPIGVVSFSNPSGIFQIRQTTAGQPVFSLGTNLGLTKAHFVNVAMTPGTGAKAILADGSAYAVNTFLSSGLRCDFSSVTVDAKYCAVTPIQLNGCINNSDLSVVNCAGITLNGMPNFSGSLLATYDATDPLSPTNQTLVTLRNGSQVGGVASGTKLTIGGQVTLYVDQTSSVGGLTAIGLSVVGAKAPSISFCGYVGSVGGIDFNTAGAELPDTATALTLDFRGARFYYLTAQSSLATAVVGPAAINIKIAGAAANPQTVRMDATMSLDTPVAITAHANVNITGRGARWPNATLSTPDASGSILPPSPLLLAPVAVAAAPQPVTYPCRIPAGSTAVQVSYQTSNAGSVPTGVITATTTAGFSAGLVAAGGGNLTASVSFPG